MAARGLTRSVPGFILAAGGYLLLWADGDVQDSGLHTNFSLSSDGSHPALGVSTDPWPASADGQGQSLVRIDPTAYGNDPANWQAASPSPGKSTP